jgi:multiple sugar transport system substrate-binding protein
MKMKMMPGFILLLAMACTGGPDSRELAPSRTLVFKHGKIAGDPAPFQAILDEFEREYPGVQVKDEILPSTTDEQHQFYVINLEGGSADFDVLAMDVIWVNEFAEAGWLRDLTHLLHPSEREDFFPGPLEAVTHDGRLYGIPWYIDAGVLYYRKDLLAKYGFPPPATWDDLVRTASHVLRREPDLYGFIWQGKQYEGLVCNALEFLWSNGGEVVQGSRVIIDSEANRDALAFMRDLIHRWRVSPELVGSSTEEPTRHIFGKGKALFMRNWPYAWNIFAREGSPVRGKVGVAPLPHFPGGASAAALGGWQLGVNRNSRHPEEADLLVRFLTSSKSQKALALSIGYKPTRRSLYRDEDLLRAQPFISSLVAIFEHARARPVSPYYMMISQVLQSEFSAVIVGIKTPEEALRAAEKHLKFILGPEGA